jgi:anaerobic selenocysteine-containing dehydrogenase
MDNKKITRRDALQLSVIGASTLALGSSVTACGAVATQNETDLAGLTTEEFKFRQQVLYHPQSLHQKRQCSNCDWYQGIELRGSCWPLRGTVEATGMCSIWSSTKE